MKLVIFMSFGRNTGLWLLWCLCVAVGTNAQVPAATSDCSTNNLFLTWLETVEPGEKLPAANTARPSGGWPICDNTWANRGTCCDVEKLKSAFNKRTTLIKDGWQKFIAGLAKFRRAVNMMRATGGANRKQLLQSMSGDTNYDLDRLTSDQADTLMARLDTFEADLATFKGNATTCFSAAARARTSIFCSGCNIGTHFTLRNNELTYKFRSETCNSVSLVCLPVWRFFFNVQAQLLVAVHLKRKTKNGAGVKPSFPKIATSESYGRLTGYLNEDCAKGEASFGCTGVALDRLCSIFVTFKNPECLMITPNTRDITTASSARLLQTGGFTSESSGSTPASDDGTGSLDYSKGINMTAEAAPISTAVTVDATFAGEDAPASQRSQGNLLACGLAIFLVSFVSVF